MSIAQKIKQTVKWLQSRVQKAGSNGLIVGVSGGVDSALCAFLIKEAFPNNSLGLILPCESLDEDREDALIVLEKCQLEYLNIDLTNNFLQIVDLIEHSFPNDGEYNFSNARANLKARLRMSTIYYLANSLNYLVVGTDNKAELYTGYFTKYGDGAVDLLPLAQLTKREVKAWSLEIGVPAKIINKKPQAGLRGNQTDEEEMGVSYAIIDDYLEGKTIPEKEKYIIERLHMVSSHKRLMPPQAPKF